MTAGVVFEQSVKLDGVEVAGITIAGSTITRGASNVNDPAPPPGYAFLELVSYDGAGDVILEYPGISWRGGLASGFVVEYEDTYEGVLSSLELGKSIEVVTTTPGGFETAYVDDYLGGYASTRFVGTIGAIDYTPGIVAVTAVSAAEQLTRVDVDPSSWPAELELARVGRIAAAAGVAVSTVGTSSRTVAATDAEQQPVNAYQLLAKLAGDCDALLYVTRPGQLVYRTHDAPDGDRVAIQPGATLLDSLKMTQELGTIVNSVTVEYGPSSARASVAVTDPDSIALYGVRDQSTSTELEQLADATAHGQRILDLFAEPYWYMPSVDVILELASSAGNDYPANLAAILELDLDDEVTVGPLLPGSPVDDYTARVLGCVETLDPISWSIRFDLNPAGWTRKATP